MNWAAFAQALLGLAEEIVPIFVHNPQSQKIEAVVLTGSSAITGMLTPMITDTVKTTAPVTSSTNVTVGSTTPGM